MVEVIENSLSDDGKYDSDHITANQDDPDSSKIETFVESGHNSQVLNVIAVISSYNSNVSNATYRAMTLQQKDYQTCLNNLNRQNNKSTETSNNYQVVQGTKV